MTSLRRIPLVKGLLEDKSFNLLTNTVNYPKFK
nr:MAG TPA: hypothetical protein [Caudoviricetes sp.]